MNELQDIQDFLSSCSPFNVLPDSELESLCRSIEISYEPGNSVVLPISAENSELHLIRRGAVALLDANNQLISKRGEREVYGYPSMLTGTPTRLLGRTVEDSLIYHIPEQNFHQLRREFPAF
ncbi:MAG: cyclic nucleotide-binding domain-containing protein, partial [Pseudomonadota bacterium]